MQSVFFIVPVNSEDRLVIPKNSLLLATSKEEKLVAALGHLENKCAEVRSLLREAGMIRTEEQPAAANLHLPAEKPSGERVGEGVVAKELDDLLAALSLKMDQTSKDAVQLREEEWRSIAQGSGLTDELADRIWV